MEDSEKLTALKKAYAEIILNTTREAAVRIMDSERKAMRFQQELQAAKEESLHMLMRIKQMLDAKSSEAEIASVSRQKKMEELEAQLQEAEDIVTELRQDMRKVQEELKQNIEHTCAKQHCMEHDAFCPEKMSENKVYPSEFTVTPLHDGSDGCPDIFASILMRLKEPELRKNKCVQRIRACRSNLDDEHEMVKQKVNETHKCSNGFKKRKVVDRSNVHPGVAKSLRRKRKRATRFRKQKASSFTNIHDNAEKEQSRSCSENSLDASSAPIFPLDADEMPSDIASDMEVCRPCSIEQFSDNAKLSTESFHPNGDLEHAKPSDLEVKKASDNVEDISVQSPRKFLYTFQRKRKREILSSPCQNHAVEEKDLRNKLVEASKGIQEPEIQSLKSESSRGSRILAQVAHQLISLSEKRR